MVILGCVTSKREPFVANPTKEFLEVTANNKLVLSATAELKEANLSSSTSKTPMQLCTYACTQCYTMYLLYHHLLSESLMQLEVNLKASCQA